MREELFDFYFDISDPKKPVEAYLEFRKKNWVYMTPHSGRIYTALMIEKGHYEMTLKEAVYALLELKTSLQERLDAKFERTMVVELQYQNYPWLEISQETERLKLEMFTQEPRKYWEFPLKEALSRIINAKKHLLSEE
jgi:hypothetical protein